MLSGGQTVQCRTETISWLVDYFYHSMALVLALLKCGISSVIYYSKWNIFDCLARRQMQFGDVTLGRCDGFFCNFNFVIERNNQQINNNVIVSFSPNVIKVLFLYYVGYSVLQFLLIYWPTYRSILNLESSINLYLI